jgi:hypothetical protein
MDNSATGKERPAKVERLMRELDLHGMIRGERICTTISDKASPCPPNRQQAKRAKRVGAWLQPMNLVSREHPVTLPDRSDQRTTP